MVTRIPTANLKGGPGPRGQRGEKGIPGVNGVENDTATATNVLDLETETGAAVEAAVAAGVVDLTPKLLAMASEILSRSIRYQMTYWLPTVHPGTDPITDFGGVLEQHIRPRAAAALGMAVALSQDVYDADIATVSEADTRVQTLRLITSLAAAHKATLGSAGWGGLQDTPPPNTNTGPNWQSVLWASYTGGAARLMWDDLTVSQRNQVLAMVKWEADRLLTWVPPYWKTAAGVETYIGDSKSEEISWTAGILVIALTMMPTDSNAQKWSQKLVEGSIACFAMTSDLTDAVPVNGLTPSAYLTGTNVNPDGTVVNHGIVHPDYMSSAAHCFDQAMSIADLVSIPLPVAVERNMAKVYASLSKVTFAPPLYLQPGGSIYPWPPVEEFYYPQGNDWGTNRPMDKAGLDVTAHAYGWDRGLTYPAARAAYLHLQYQIRLQKRSSDGRTYMTAGEDNYAGREQWVTANAGAAVLALLASRTKVRTWSNVYLPKYATWAAAMAGLAPALWWKLNETSGTALADSSGNNRAGAVAAGSGLTMGVASLIPSAPTDKALTIGAPGVLITRAHEAWMDDTSFSVAFSLKKAAAPTATQIITGVTSTGVPSTRQWQIGIRDTGQIFASTFNGANATDLNTSTNVCDGVARLIVLTIDGTTARLYVDGALAGSLSGVVVNSSANALLCLGGRRNDADPAVLSLPLTNATIDDFTYFTTPLDADVVANLREAWANPPA